MSRTNTRQTMAAAAHAALGAVLGGHLVGAHPVAAQVSVPRQAKAPHVEVSLVTSEATLASSGEAWLGVRFQLDPQWHIYWINPGDSGGPPTALWEAPAGVTVGDFVWPVPQRIPLGPLVNYGYEGDVVLPFPVKATPASAAKPATLVASLRWLVCHDICVPGKARVAITLPLAGADRSQVDAWRASISDARGRVPKPTPRSWSATARSAGDDFLLTVTMDGPAPSSAVFFPLEISQVNESAPQKVETSGRQLRLTLRKSDQLGALPRLLKGVLALPDGRAFVVEAPVGGAAKSPANDR